MSPGFEEGLHATIDQTVSHQKSNGLSVSLAAAELRKAATDVAAAEDAKNVARVRKQMTEYRDEET